MKVALIFPPAMHPTSPPLGISTLKAFLKEKNPGCSVRLWDLNPACYRKALEWMREGKLRIRLRDLDAGTTLARVEEAHAFFLGRAGMEAFLISPATMPRRGCIGVSSWYSTAFWKTSPGGSLWARRSPPWRRGSSGN